MTMGLPRGARGLYRRLLCLRCGEPAKLAGSESIAGMNRCVSLPTRQCLSIMNTLSERWERNEY